MRLLMWSLAAVLLAGMTARGDEPSDRQIIEQIRKQEIGRLRATEAYYRKAGKTRQADYYRGAAELAEKKAAHVPTIYVPVIKIDGLPRDEAIRLTEVLIKSIEREGIYKVVGRPDEADLIFEGTLRPGDRPKP
jgi:hypothetical protein